LKNIAIGKDFLSKQNKAMGKEVDKETGVLFLQNIKVLTKRRWQCSSSGKLAVKKCIYHGLL